MNLVKLGDLFKVVSVQPHCAWLPVHRVVSLCPSCLSAGTLPYPTRSPAFTGLLCAEPLTELSGQGSGCRGEDRPWAV